jgi:hypothetical protein
VTLGMIGSPRHPQIAASFSIIVPRIGFPGNLEPLPQIYDGRPSIPKPCEQRNMDRIAALIDPRSTTAGLPV